MPDPASPPAAVAPLSWAERTLDLPTAWSDLPSAAWPRTLGQWASTAVTTVIAARLTIAALRSVRSGAAG